MTIAVTPVRILIVDDHPLIREGIKAQLAASSEWEVCGEAETCEEAIRRIIETSPDVVIVDLSLRGGNGLELIKQIAAISGGPKILVCSMHDEKLYAQRSIHAGALGFVHKQQTSQLLVQAIRRILTGKIFVSDEISDVVLSHLLHDQERGVVNPVEQLTERELQVFESIGRGMTVDQIAAALFLSRKTIETYRERTKRKLNLRTSAELLRYAVKWAVEHTGN